MEKKRKSTGARVLKVFFVLVVILVTLPLLLVGVSFIGRVSPDSVIPGSFSVYLRVPHVVRAAEHLLCHKGLEDIVADPSFSSLAPVVSTIREQKILSHPLVRFAGKGELSAGVYEDGTFLLAWDLTTLSLFSRIIPGFISKLTIPGLYRVQSGRLTRFELRLEDGTVLFVEPWKNLLLVSNNALLFESCLRGDTQLARLQDPVERNFSKKNFDAGLLLEGDQFLSSLKQNTTITGDIAALIASLSSSGRTEARISIAKEIIHIESVIPLSSRIPVLSSVLTTDSRVPSLLGSLPEKTQYSTIISAGSVKNLIDIALSINKNEILPLLKKADTSSRLLLGLSLDDLLYSWTGSEIGVWGLEGKPKPVFAVRISDESKRKHVFDKLLGSFALTGDSSVILDGVRIPRIRLPDFLSSLLRVWDVFVPTPYYLVERGFLLISESPENLVYCVNAMRQNNTLIKTSFWKELSAEASDESALSLHYSLDRSTPFFLRGNGPLQRLLQLYEKGLFRIAIRKENILVSLNLRSGTSTGPIPLQGYPINFDTQIGNRVHVSQFSVKNESRIIVSSGKKVVVSIRPDTGERYAFESDDELTYIPMEDLRPRTSEIPSGWIVSSRGEVRLVNGNLETQTGFPVLSGLKLSAEPVAFEGKLYLCDQDSSLFVMHDTGEKFTISLPFSGVLRSPPSFIKIQGAGFMATYPKSFFGEIWLTDLLGKPTVGWPVPVPGIAFGSPVLSMNDKKILVAFITQAGEFLVLDKEGMPVLGFPLQLDGVFFLQPVFDGTYYWAISASGELFRVGLDSSVKSVRIPGFSAESGFLVHHDIDGDSISEIFVTGDGNTLHGYSSDLDPLVGFPLPSWGLPWFGDLNGDKKSECIAAGMNNSLNAWQLR